MKELAIIQSKLKAPKGQFNQFGKYKYRSCEDILEAVKPLLSETECTLTIADSIVPVGNRIYVQATATLKNAAGETEVTTAFAREEDMKKGMDGSQVTGAASSYARKYALNGLFAIDDNKDSDSTNTHGKDEHNSKAPIASETDLNKAMSELECCNTQSDVRKLWSEWSAKAPQICAQGGKFYVAVGAKIKVLPQ